MSALTQVQCIEVFHLLFLAHAGQTLDKRCYALKGGCNLQFALKVVEALRSGHENP